MRQPAVLSPAIALAFAALTLPRPAEACDETGRVVDARGNPVAGLIVEVTTDSTRRVAVTDGDGRYGFGKLSESARIVVNLRRHAKGGAAFDGFGCSFDILGWRVGHVRRLVHMLADMAPKILWTLDAGETLLEGDLAHGDRDACRNLPD